MSGDPETSAADMDCNSFFDLVEDLLLDFPEDGKNDSEIDAGVVGDAFAPYSLLNPDLAAELSIPYEDLVQMEWLSTFMEDSFSAGSDALTVNGREFPTEVAEVASAAVGPQFRSSSPISVLESSTTSSSSSSERPKMPPLGPDKGNGCVRARTKRPRPQAEEVYASPYPAEGKKFSESSERKKKRNEKPSVESGVRKCLHCEITKTPQWRAGPMGPKTLCNACGVRYKSGRLFPEYRPAASPTFVPALHSNSHKKVLEMRTTALDDVDHAELIPNKDAMLDEYIQRKDLST